MNNDTNHWEQGGPNLVHSYPQHKKGKTSFNNYTPLNQSGDTFWLSTLSEWRFMNVTSSFNRANHLTPRPLQVTAYVKQDGEVVEQSLGHMHYVPQGRSATLFVPTQKTFYDIAVTKWEEVEFVVKEIKNNLDVSFASVGELFLILHFKQDMHVK